MHELHTHALRALDVAGLQRECLAAISDWLVLRRQ
jgi:hypothetical protein